MTDFQKLLRTDYKKWYDKPFVFEKKGGIYQSITYGKFLDRSAALADKLLKMGFSDKRIVLFGRNSINLMLCDLAVITFVGTSVHISFTTQADEMAEMLKKISVHAVLYDNQLFDVIENVRAKCPDIIFLDMEEILPEDGNGIPDSLPVRNQDECCKILFSNGTTEDPKAVMLSMRNILAGWEPLYRRAPLCETDIFYLFLPLHHTYGNIYNFLYCFFSGAQIYLCSSIEKMAEEILEVQPTIFCAVPLIFRRLYTAYGNNLSKAFGNRIKYLFSAGSYFDRELRKFYKQQGLPLANAYGLSETASSFSIEYPNTDDIDSVGTVFENLDVRILNPDKNGVGEIAVKGDAVFCGYAENEERTRNVFTDDGYFLTGDCGYMRDRLLFITGRKKRIFLGENGENIYPDEIASKLRSICPEIESLKIQMKNDRLHCVVSFVSGSQTDAEKLFADYNAYAAKQDRICTYKVITLRADASLCKT